MKASLTEHVLEWCQANVPAQYAVDALTELSPDVPKGTVKIRVTLHDSRPRAVTYPVLSVLDTEPWNAGERTPAAIGELFTAELVEPYVTWAGDISWRVTAAGKKAGLK